MVAIVALSLMVAGQWLLIWRLVDRLLITNNVPSLGPVRVNPPAETPDPKKPRKIATLPIQI
jgi:hypothetical protein